VQAQIQHVVFSVSPDWMSSLLFCKVRRCRCLDSLCAERSPGVRCCRTSRCPLVHPLLIKLMQPPQTEERRPERFAAHIAARRVDPPRPLLIRAAGLAEPKDHALDAGAGALNATRYLLSAGFKYVTAFDSSPASQTVAAELPREQVRFVLSRFEDFDYADRAYEFVNAEFSLPSSVFTKLMASVTIGGLFTGQLFGPNDSWNLPESGMNFHSRSDVSGCCAAGPDVTEDMEPHLSP
jgi:hypothetical protein